MHLFLSPHPDDVVLSCGGAIHELVQQGHAVGVLTLMAADAPDPLPDNPLIGALHQRWALGDNPYEARRKEDVQALATLGVTDVRFGKWQDCVYRTDSSGQALYADDDALFGGIRLTDPLRTAVLDLSAWEDVSHLYAPLGAGNHVDHRLVRDKALQISEVAICLYEEYPYSADTGEVHHAHSGAEERLEGSTALEVAKSSLPGDVVAQVCALSDAALHAKIEAIQCYQSQISTFWDSLEQMKLSLRAYTQAVGERLWLYQS